MFFLKLLFFIVTFFIVKKFIIKKQSQQLKKLISLMDI